MPPALGLLLGLSLVGALQPSLEPLQYEPTEEGAILFADSYNSSAEVVLFKSVSASWDYYTNLTDKNAALQVGGGMGGDVTVGVSPAPGLLGGGGAGARWGHLVWSLSSLREPFWAPQDGKPGLGLVVREPQGFAPNWPSESFCTGVTALILGQTPGYF